MRTLIEIRKAIEETRFEYAKYLKEAKRRHVPIQEVAGTSTLYRIKTQLSEIIQEVEGQDSKLYNRAVVLYNAVLSDLKEALYEN